MCVADVDICRELLAIALCAGSLRLALYLKYSGYPRKRYCFDSSVANIAPSNQTMKPTRPLQENLNGFATTACVGLSLSR